MEDVATSVYPIDMHPMWVNLEPAMEELQGYSQADDDRNVFACIASYANAQGEAWPTERNIAHKTGLALKRVQRSIWRLKFKNFLAVPRQEKKNRDIHPRNIYQIVKDFLRKAPDKLSNHFDAEKWKPFAAMLKKHVADAVDTVKQVAVKAAKTMSAAKTEKPRKRSKKQWNNSYRNNSWQRNSYSVPAEPLSPEERERKQWIDRLIEQGKDALEKAHMTSDGEFEAWRYLANQVRKTPEKYDQILQEAIDKFKDFQNLNCWETRVQLGLDPLGMYKGRSSSPVQNVRLMSHDDDPMSFKGALGAAFA